MTLPPSREGSAGWEGADCEHEKAPSVTGGAFRKISVRSVQRTRNLSVHPLMVDSMNQLQSVAVRKTPIAITQKISKCEGARCAMPNARMRGLLAADKQTGPPPSVA